MCYIYKVGDSTSALGSLLQCLTVHPLEELFLISNPDLPWRPFPLVLLLFPWEKRWSPTWLCADLGKDVVTWTTRSWRRECFNHLCLWYKMPTWYLRVVIFEYCHWLKKNLNVITKNIFWGNIFKTYVVSDPWDWLTALAAIRVSIVFTGEAKCESRALESRL